MGGPAAERRLRLAQRDHVRELPPEPLVQVRVATARFSPHRPHAQTTTSRLEPVARSVTTHRLGSSPTALATRTGSGHCRAGVPAEAPCSTTRHRRRPSRGARASRARTPPGTGGTTTPSSRSRAPDPAVADVAVLMVGVAPGVQPGTGAAPLPTPVPPRVGAPVERDALEAGAAPPEPRAPRFSHRASRKRSRLGTAGTRRRTMPARGRHPGVRPTS